MNKIIDKQTAEHYIWGDNCDSWILADTLGLSVKQESMPSSTREKLHFHNKAQQFFYILKGSATFYLDNVKTILTEQKGILIEPMTKHYIANETSEQLEFLVYFIAGIRTADGSNYWYGIIDDQGKEVTPFIFCHISEEFDKNGKLKFCLKDKREAMDFKAFLQKYRK